MVDADEFVVEVNRDAVEQARARMLQAMTSSAYVSLIGGAVLVALGVVIILLEPVVGVLELIPAVLFLQLGVSTVRKRRRLNALWAAQGVPPTAMRISGAGLRVSIDAAPDSIFLPWSCVQGFHLRRAGGQQRLVLELMPGVTATTPGVTGLDHPDAQRALRGKPRGVTGPRTAVRMLRQPPAAIDQALAGYTDGRVRIAEGRPGA